MNLEGAGNMESFQASVRPQRAPPRVRPRPPRHADADNHPARPGPAPSPLFPQLLHHGGLHPKKVYRNMPVPVLYELVRGGGRAPPAGRARRHGGTGGAPAGARGAA
jgi:hypothetical protein